MDKKVGNNPAPPIDTQFKGASNVSRDYFLKIKANIDLLLKNLEQYGTEESVNTPEAEADIKAKFQQFLLGCEFYVAQSDFNDLLEEANPRDNGTVGWYHQLTPILIVLSMIRDKTIDLDDLHYYGGLETAIRTALRHDSIEDFGKDFDQFEADQRQKIERVLSGLVDRGIPVDANKRAEEQKNLEILMENLRLMTKKVAVLDPEGNPQYHEDGRMVKKSLFDTDSDYIHNMVESRYANPVVWILKVCDGIHNLSTMIGAPKFTAIRRRDYANQREDMYGSRDGLPEKAMTKWSAFASAIKRVDSMMGSILYTNFGYLKYVDQDAAYPAPNEKFKDGQTIRSVGIAKYLPDTVAINIPGGFNPFMNLLDTIKKQINENSDTIESKRIKLFWEESVKPSLYPYATHFPHIFAKPSGPTFADRTVRIPQFL